VPGLRREPDQLSRRRELDGVPDQVHERLLQALRIAPEPASARSTTSRTRSSAASPINSTSARADLAPGTADGRDGSRPLEPADVEQVVTRRTSRSVLAVAMPRIRDRSSANRHRPPRPRARCWRG